MKRLIMFAAAFGIAGSAAAQDAAQADPVAEHVEAASISASYYQGMGGPIEAEDDYPPCAPGPGDDNCIQLYEQGRGD